MEVRYFRPAWVLGMLLPATVLAGETDVLLNELYYDAPGSDAGNEWIEILNVGGDSVDLSGWKLQRGGTAFQTVFTFPSGASIPGSGRILVGEQNVPGAQFTASLAFQNGGGATDGVRLTAGGGGIVDVVLYDQPNANALPDKSGSPGSSFAPPAPEGSSLARLPDGAQGYGDSRDFSVTDVLTPGSPNAAGGSPSPASAAPSPASSSSTAGAADAVVVNEILPNPVGSDEEGEFLELWNSGTTTANLSGYKIDDAEGGSTPYVIPDGTTLAPKVYLLLRRPETKLAFNNDADRGRLLRPDKSLVHELVYDGAPKGEGSSVARRADGTATWTSTPTPGAENTFQSASVTTSAASTSAASASPKSTTASSPFPRASAPPSSASSSSTGRVRGTTTVAEAPGSPSAARASSSSNRQNAQSAQEKEQGPETVALSDLRSKDIGSEVTTEGAVSVLPGVLDPRLFYLAGSGIGVVLTDGQFPELKIGDVVAVTGKLAEPRKERLLAVAAAEAIVRTAGGAPPEPHAAKTGDIGEALEGSLGRVEGTAADVADRQFTVDDGSGPTRVRQVGTVAWPADIIRRDARVRVVGIVSESEDGFSLLPRSPEDVQSADAERAQPTRSQRLPWLRWVGMALIIVGVSVYLLRRWKEIPAL